jgi:hypothetical protein
MDREALANHLSRKFGDDIAADPGRGPLPLFSIGSQSIRPPAGGELLFCEN